MPHDNTGQELHVGDIVLVPARIKAIHQTEHYCNITLVTREVMPPTTEPTELTLNSHQVYRDPFNGGPPRASRDAGQPANDALQVIARGDIVLDGDQWYVMRPLKGIIPKHDGPFASWQEAYQYWLTHRVNGTPSTEVNKADREPAADPKDTINTVEAVSQTAQLGAGHAEAPREDATQEITNDEARRAAGLFFGTGRSSMLREEDGVIFAKILEDFRSRRAARSSGKTGAK